jgi:hypothetical protein
VDRLGLGANAEAVPAAIRRIAADANFILEFIWFIVCCKQYIRKRCCDVVDGNLRLSSFVVCVDDTSAVG